MPHWITNYTIILLSVLLAPFLSECLATTLDSKCSGGKIEKISEARDIHNSLVSPRSSPDEIELSNNAGALKIDSCARMRSLRVGGRELLSHPNNPLARIYFEDGRTVVANKLEQINQNEFRLRFKDSGIVLHLGIKVDPHGFIFSIIDLQPNKVIRAVTFLDVASKHVAQARDDKEWAQKATDEEPFLATVVLNPQTICDIDVRYRCRAHHELGLVGARALLLTSRKGNYLQNRQDIISRFDLPFAEIQGQWIRNADPTSFSYLFANVTHENHETLLRLAQRGGFDQILMTSPVVRGLYSQPKLKNFSSTEQYFTDMERLRRGGLRLGLHTLFGHIEPTDPLFELDNLLQFPIARLNGNVSSSQLDLPADNRLETNKAFKPYARYDWNSSKFAYLRIDDEIMRCNAQHFIKCKRGLYNTKAASHTSGALVRFVPYRGGAFWLDINNKELLRSSVSSFSALVQKLKIDFVYADGLSYLSPPDMEGDPGADIAYRHSKGLLPYLETFDTPPRLQSGGGVSAWDSHYCNRVATWDGVVFKNKAFTRNFKVPSMTAVSPYADIQHEMGWWKINGAKLSDGRGDYEATTYDDVHYAMTKVLALQSSIGLQLHPTAYQNAYLNELFDLIGLYHRAMRVSSGLRQKPAPVKEFLSEPREEAELAETAGKFQLIHKLTSQHYVHLGQKEKGAEILVWNPFGKQPLRAEVRPRFDYFPFNDERHLLLSDFSTDDIVIKASGTDVSCVQHGGELVMRHAGKGVGGCRLDLPGNFNLAYRRGIGLDITGDGHGEVVVTHLHNGAWGFRDYRLAVDFAARRQWVLGDPTTDLSDPVKGQVNSVNRTWQFSRLRRNWDYDYGSSNNTLSIFVFALPGQHKLTFHRVLALQEKGNSKLVNPSIELNGQRVVFPVTLSMAPNAPNILEIDGPLRRYRLYTENYQLLDERNLESNASLVKSGQNRLIIKADTSDPKYSTRLDLRVSVYDDEDADRVPTNGDYKNVYSPCNGSTNYCDDNCPRVPNPDQSDNDGDGRGDACES